MIDSEGFRPNVGIIVANEDGNVLWARRIGEDAWQFPQGGLNEGESVEEALFRELKEETGLKEESVRIIACTKGWLRYKLPSRYLRQDSSFVGQKQKWYLLKLLTTEQDISVFQGQSPEFDHWQWVSYWYPLGQVVSFKKDVYRKALKELAPYLSTVMSPGD